MTNFMENPFGERNTLEEYTKKYLHALDSFFHEAQSFGVWVSTEEPLTAQTTYHTVNTLSMLSGTEKKNYSPFWSSPADALAFGLYANIDSPQSISLEKFSRLILQTASHSSVAGLNPAIRNSKKHDDGSVTIALFPPVLIPLYILEAIYRGEKTATFNEELAQWIAISRNNKKLV